MHSIERDQQIVIPTMHLRQSGWDYPLIDMPSRNIRRRVCNKSNIKVENDLDIGNQIKLATQNAN